jgi:hypothetical protein
MVVSYSGGPQAGRRELDGSTLFPPTEESFWYTEDGRLIVAWTKKGIVIGGRHEEVKLEMGNSNITVGEQGTLVVNGDFEHEPNSITPRVTPTKQADTITNDWVTLGSATQNISSLSNSAGDGTNPDAIFYSVKTNTKFFIPKIWNNGTPGTLVMVLHDIDQFPTAVVDLPSDLQVDIVVFANNENLGPTFKQTNVTARALNVVPILH